MLKIAIVDLSRSNFSIARAPIFQLKSATWPVIIGGKLIQHLQYI